MIRREFLRAAAIGAGAAALPLSASGRTASAVEGFVLSKLPYGYDALEPIIDAETMTIHHTKHHQAYVDNLNKALAGKADWLAMPIEQILKKLAEFPEAIRSAVRNNGGGHWNHDFFWSIMAKPGTGGAGPGGEFLKSIDESFGSVDAMKKQFLAAATGRFGSGWAWLIRGKMKPLEIVSSPNQDNPLMGGGPRPILGIDVWEHAYYLKYRNLRAKYVEAWFGVVNWQVVGENYAKSAA